MLNVFSVILAGGSGTRFWPLSRNGTPKQVLNLSGNDALINEAIKRCMSIIPEENCFVVTNIKQKENIKAVLFSDKLVNNVISEPQSKNTSACILLAALKLKNKFKDGVMCVFPSDHYITNQSEFEKVLNLSIDLAGSSGSIVTLGIKPSYPATGYGYIRFDANEKNSKFHPVLEFIEKPHIDNAKMYISSGDYLWNSGVFIFKISVILENFKRFLPRLYNQMLPFEDVIGTEQEDTILNRLYESVPSISIDYGIIERSSDVLVIPADMGWNDVGSFDSLGAIFPPDQNGNIVRGQHILIDTANSIIYSENSLIGAIGIEDMVIVNADDALLVCNKKDAQNVKKIVEALQHKNLNQYL